MCLLVLKLLCFHKINRLSSYLAFLCTQSTLGWKVSLSSTIVPRYFNSVTCSTACPLMTTGLRKASVFPFRHNSLDTLINLMTESQSVTLCHSSDLRRVYLRWASTVKITDCVWIVITQTWCRGSLKYLPLLALHLCASIRYVGVEAACMPLSGSPFMLRNNQKSCRFHLENLSVKYWKGVL